MEDSDQVLLAAQLLLDDDRLQNEAATRDAAEDSDSNDGDGYDDDGGGDGDAPGAPAGRRRRRRRWWVHPWIGRRPEYGQYNVLMWELEHEDVQSFKNFLRFDPEQFQNILARVGPALTKRRTNYREPLEPGLKLALVRRHFASGDNYKSLMYGFRVSKSSIVKIMPDVAEAIIEEYGDELVSAPTTPEGWNALADRFLLRWNLPHCVGAIDGKHVAIQCPRRGGSVYYNYKGYHSIILFAAADAYYKFTWVDVGANGSASDCQVFNSSELKEAIKDDTIGFPDPDPLPGDNVDMPYFLAGDNAFPLRTWLMKPFSRRELDNDERIFNYRLSRGRRVIESAFGILANRFRVLLTTIRQSPGTFTKIVLACVCLHNLLRSGEHGPPPSVDLEDEQHNVIPGQWRGEAQMDDLEAVTGNRTTKEAKRQRLSLKHYFMLDAGAIEWQQQMI
ncbi:hypothetical protein ACOMHN_026155 [Nucella lapillus]